MSDLIDRQAAIDAFERFIHELGIKDEPYNYGEMALSARNVPSVEDKGDFDGMTNGEVIQALFPYVKTEDTSFNTLIGTNLDKGYIPLQREWWNAPYKAKKGGE